VDLRVLHRAFEEAVKRYQAQLECDNNLQTKFANIVSDYGWIDIG
jgi:hypothetical protein